MASLWKLGGLTPLKPAKLGITKIDEDDCVAHRGVADDVLRHVSVVLDHLLLRA